MNDDIDWEAKAIVHERSDDGSEMFIHFEQVREGTLAAMVRSVAELPPEARARIIMDVAGAGNLDIGQIMALAARSDIPA